MVVFVIWYSGLLNLIYERADVVEGAPELYTWSTFTVALLSVLVSSVFAARLLRSVSSSGGTSVVSKAPATARAISIIVLTLCLVWFPVIRVQERLLGVGFPGINFLIPMLTVALFIVFRKGRQAVGWLCFGRYDPVSWATTGLVVVASGGGLVAWAQLDAPTIWEQASQLLFVPRALWIPAALGFSLSNATVEEVLFRGVIWDGLAPRMPRWSVVAVTSALFALFHLYGFPSGPVGMTMVFVWGVALGILRIRTRGMLAPIVTHIGADLVIFAILAARVGGGDFPL